MATTLVACGSAPVPSPTVRAVATDAAGSPLPTRPPAPERSRTPISLGPPGTVVAVETSTGEPGAIAITLRAAVAGSSPTRDRDATALPPKGWHLADDPRPRVSADGFLALEVTDDEEQAVRTIVVDLESGGSRVTQALAGTNATWLPDGSLVTAEQVVEGEQPFDVVRRYPDHGAGAPAELRVESPLNLDGRVSVAPDLSGVHVTRVASGDRLERLVLRWDGSAIDRVNDASAISGLGRERLVGVGGSTASEFCADPGGCGILWRRADGSSVPLSLPAGIQGGSAAWTPDGSRLVVVGSGSAFQARDGRPVPVLTGLGPLRVLPPEAQIVGVTNTAAVVQANDGVYLVALDGSGTTGPITGLAAGVLP